MDSNTRIGVLCKTPCVNSDWLTYQKGITHDQKDGVKLHALPLSRYLENALGLITYILTLNGVLHNPTRNLKGNQYFNWGIM